MSLSDDLARQCDAFHHAILDNCNRAARPGQTDAMALLLRMNAVALAHLQRTIRTRLPAETDQTTSPEANPREANPPEAGTPEHDRPDHDRPDHDRPDQDRPDHLLTGDALSRFVSRRLAPDESPHAVWQRLHDEHSAQPRRNPASAGPGFRSAAG